MTKECEGTRNGSQIPIDASEQEATTEDAHSEQQLDRFFTLSLDLFCIARTDGFFLRLSPSFERTLGWSAAELMGSPFVSFVHPDDVDATLAEVDRLGSGENVIRFENRYRCKDGSYRWFLWTSTASPDGYIYAAARDITERKQIEASLARSNEHLAQFAYVASHDLQEPLRKIVSFLALLGERYAAQLDDQARSYIDRSVDAARRMGALIHDLLAYAQVDQTALECAEADTAVIAARALDNLQAHLDETGAAVDLGTLPRVPCIEPLLTQVFQNLIANALKFRTPEKPPRVQVTAARADAAWTFSVTDNGIGIDPEHRERIFEMFARLHGRTSYAGTGIGLALCRRIVELHGGHIWVDDVAHGTRISFMLPDGATRAETAVTAG